MFFVGYAAFQVPSNLILQKVGPAWLSVIIVAWGTISALGALITDGNGYIVQRVFLGMVESGCFPGGPAVFNPGGACGYWLWHYYVKTTII